MREQHQLATGMKRNAHRAEAAAARAQASMQRAHSRYDSEAERAEQEASSTSATLVLAPT
jgi:hypothetical protein